VIPVHTIIDVYRVGPIMQLVRVLPSAQDEVNAAAFHPFKVLSFPTPPFWPPPIVFSTLRRSARSRAVMACIVRTYVMIGGTCIVLFIAIASSAIAMNNRRVCPHSSC
jgi:hypothetical protein